jgi:hypothetical protein
MDRHALLLKDGLLDNAQVPIPLDFFIPTDFTSNSIGAGIFAVFRFLRGSNAQWDLKGL